MEIDESADRIQTREDLAAFIHDLRRDLAHNPEEWENPTLDRFLEAMAGWIEDADGFYRNQGLPAPSADAWRTVAQALSAARVYE
jgi:hypothetical protein